jgi:hypothetical protein
MNLAQFHQFAATTKGARVSLVAIILVLFSLAYQGWRDLPWRPKPATMLEYRASAEWHGPDLWIRLRYRINKVRDCPYSSDRAIEYEEPSGELRSFRIEGANTGSVAVSDTSWDETTFKETDGILQPGMKAKLTVRGIYRCPEANFVADPINAEFSVPPRPKAATAPLLIPS